MVRISRINTPQLPPPPTLIRINVLAHFLYILLPAVLLAACTQDELAEQGNTLPDGEYPLQIGSVSITAEASEEPWTRVTEKPDGSGSVWQPDDAITVSLDGETATYTYDGSAWTSDAPLYWKNTQPAEVTAWWCMCCGPRQTTQATTLLLTCSSSTNLPRYE